MEINKIHLGDCLELMQDIPDKAVDMILCDLLYSVSHCKWDIIIPFEELWEQYNRIIKDNGAIVLTGIQPFTSLLIMINLKYFRYSLVWEKTTSTGFLNAKKMPLRKHEDIVVFYKKLPTYNPIKTYNHPRKASSKEHKRNCIKTDIYNNHNLTSYDSTERYPTSVLTFKTDKQINALHPTQKPVGLFEYLIKTYTNENELVLDNCIGSGTTAVACINTHRNFIGMEKDEKFFQIANNRLNKG